MGGDDLGSDDDYLTGPLGDGVADDSSGDERTNLSESKRKENGSSDDDAPTKKKRKRGDDDALKRLGLSVRTLSTEEQSKLVAEFADAKFRSHHVAKSDDAAESLMKRIQGVISKKKMKKWNQKQSPCVLIVCVSARRAVQVLKELSPFNIRAAKLFAKHMTIEQQIDMLESGAFGLAVGTPHRILALLQQGALSLKQTQVVVLDAFLNQKNYSVYTLPDTVPHTQELLKDHVYAECSQRKDLRIAFA